MCNVIKLQNKKKNFQLKVSSGVEEVYTNFASDEELKARELKAEYEKGYNDAVEDLKEKIKKEFEAKLQNEADKFQNILKAIDNELTNYEERFSEMVVTIEKLMRIPPFLKILVQYLKNLLAQII
jgi:flagellar biosynthesis/type III secretory pathway protein FliH